MILINGSVAFSGTKGLTKRCITMFNRKGLTPAWLSNQQLSVLGLQS